MRYQFITVSHMNHNIDQEAAASSSNTRTSRKTSTCTSTRMSRLLLAAMVALVALASLPTASARVGMVANHRSKGPVAFVEKFEHSMQVDFSMSMSMPPYHGKGKGGKGKKGKGGKGKKSKKSKKSKGSKKSKKGKKGYGECYDGASSGKGKHKRRCRDTDPKDQHDKLQRPTQSPIEESSSEDSDDADAPMTSPTPWPSPFPTPELDEPPDPAPSMTPPPSIISDDDTMVATQSPTPAPAVLLQENSLVETQSPTGGGEGEGDPIETASPTSSGTSTSTSTMEPTMSTNGPTSSGSASDTTGGSTEGPTIVEALEIVDADSAPSQAPTDALGFVAEAAEPREYRLWVASDPLEFQAVGTVDVNQAREAFYEIVDSLMFTYFEGSMGGLLQKFELDIEFMTQETKKMPTGLTGMNFLTISYFNVFVDLEIVSDNIQDLNRFQDRQATAAVESFFRGGSHDQLIAELKLASIQVETIIPVDESMDNFLAGLPSVEDLVVGSAPQYSEPKGTNEKDKTTALYAGLVSGGVALALLGVALVFNRRKKRQFVAYYPGDSASDSMYTDGTRSMIRPASLTVKCNDTEDDSSSQPSEFSSLYNPAHKALDALSASRSFVSPQMSFGSEDNDDGEGEDEAGGFVNAGAMVPLDTKPEYGPPTSALTCLDATENVDKLTNEYPEFAMYSSVNQQPRPGTSIPFSYKMDDEEYKKQRQRWHDETDLASIVLPDHSSEKGYATATSDERTHNSDRTETSEERTLTSSDEDDDESSLEDVHM